MPAQSTPEYDGAFIHYAGCTPTVPDGFVARRAGAVARPPFGTRTKLKPLAVWNSENPRAATRGLEITELHARVVDFVA